MAFSFAAARDWGSRGRLLFRLQAVLIGVLCFAAGAVPRLLPALFGILALVAAMHVLTVQPRLPLKLLRTAFGIALAIFVAYLFVNATWAPDRPAGLAKAATVLWACGWSVPARRVLFLAHWCRRARAREVRARGSPARSGLPLDRDQLSRAGHALRQQSPRAAVRHHPPRR
jgi:energy-coupling factor transporter transmembrane protein EcfT